MTNADSERFGGRALRRRPPCRNYGGDARSNELADRMVALAREMSALQRELLAHIAEFDRAEAWRGDGCTSMVAWVTGQCRVSASTARSWVQSAANLVSLPCLAEGLGSGELSLDVVEPLAEVATPATDAALREASAHWSVRQARELAAWYRAQEEEFSAPVGAETVGADGVGTETAGTETAGTETAGTEAGPGGSAVREFDRRTLRFNDTRKTAWIAFTKDDYAAAKSALVGQAAADKRAEERGRQMARAQSSGQEAGVEGWRYVSYDQRLYDAFMHLFHGGVGGVRGRRGDRGGGAGPGGLEGGGRALRPRVVVHAPLELLLGCMKVEGVLRGAGEPSVPRVVEIAGVGPIQAEVARRLACDARVVLSVEGRDGSVLDQGRARRDPTPAQRMEIERRDKGCRFPGCTYTEFTDVHHIRHWTRGGETNLDNLVTLCDRHHKAVHELGWSLRGDPNGELSFVGPHGRVMKSVPSPTWRPSMSGVPVRAGPKRRE